MKNILILGLFLSLLACGRKGDLYLEPAQERKLATEKQEEDAAKSGKGN